MNEFYKLEIDDAKLQRIEKLLSNHAVLIGNRLTMPGTYGLAQIKEFSEELETIYITEIELQKSVEQSRIEAQKKIEKAARKKKNNKDNKEEKKNEK